MYYDEVDGRLERIGALEWHQKYKEIDKKVVARDIVGPLVISTVFLGFDHNPSGVGLPLVYETMIFNSDDEDVWTERYSFRKDAEEKHAWVVKELTRIWEEGHVDQGQHCLNI